MYYLTLNSTEFRQSSQIRGGGGIVWEPEKDVWRGGKIFFFGYNDYLQAHQM